MSNVLPETTQMEVYNPTNPIKAFQSNNPFTLFEHFKGDMYAVVFQLWFSPKNGGADILLKNNYYLIDG